MCECDCGELFNSQAAADQCSRDCLEADRVTVAAMAHRRRGCRDDTPPEAA